MYVVVEWEINGLNGGRKFSPIMTAEEYEEAQENGDWSHSSMGAIYFDTRKEAEEYIEKWENMHIVVYCPRMPEWGLFMANANDENICSQPSLYDILFEGTEEECHKYIEEHENEYELEAE